MGKVNREKAITIKLQSRVTRKVIAANFILSLNHKMYTSPLVSVPYNSFAMLNCISYDHR